jgi:hypothetical protein
MKHWTQRVRPPGPRELQNIRDAAEDLERQAKRAPHGTGPVFEKVTQVLFLGTALLSTVLASIHLYNKLSRPHHSPPRDGHEPGQQSGDDRRPPRRHVAAAASHGHGRE